MRDFTILIRRVIGIWKQAIRHDQFILFLSVLLQITAGVLFGHFYDMRIFMATGYLVGSGQNPYIPQDLSAVFHNESFQGMTSVGYFPPWPLMLGILYRSIYALAPDLMVYNLAIKLPVIVANICQAYLVTDILRYLKVESPVIRKAWVFMLLCPAIIYFGPAWGQFDVIVSLLSLLSLLNLARDRLRISAILIGLAIAFKPTALPIFPVVILYIGRKSSGLVFRYALWFFSTLVLFCVLPFQLLGWNLIPILHGWNAHFTVAGAMSFMTFFELLQNTYQLPGAWWLLGLIWIPAVVVAIYASRHAGSEFPDLIAKSLGMILVFYLTRTWLSEPNIILVIPFVLILVAIGRLNRIALGAVWIFPLVFTLFNASPPQLLFLNFPSIMKSILDFQEEYRMFRLIARIILVIPWQIAGWWIVVSCFKQTPNEPAKIHRELLANRI